MTETLHGQGQGHGADQATLAEFYDREWSDEAASQPYRAFWRFRGSARDAAEAALGPVARRRLLELAPGNGISTARFARQGASIVAVELSRVGLRALVARVARAGYAAKVAPVRADVLRLPLADGSVDLISGEGILPHVDPATLAAECRRVLRPGGRAVFMEPTAHHPFVRLYRRFRYPYADTAPRHLSLDDDLPRLAAPFAAVAHEEFYLFSILALPFVGRPFLFALAFRLLDALDRGLHRLVPATRRLGWLTVIRLAVDAESRG